MTEKELHERVVALRRSADEVVEAALEMAPTVELCCFTGKLSAVLDVLVVLEEAGPPVHEPHEKPHPLRRV